MSNELNTIVTVPYDPGTKRAWRGRAPKRVVDYETVSEVNWGRLAAYMDGEGCICVSNQYNRRRKVVSRSYNIYLAVGNTDVRLCQWLETHFGGSTTTVQPRCRGYKIQKLAFTWRLSGLAIDRVLQGMLPYLVIKQEQAEIAIAFRDTFKDRRRTNATYRVPAEVMELRLKLKGDLQRSKNAFAVLITDVKEK